MLAGAAGLIFGNASAGLALAYFAVALLTLITIPNLPPGKYDNFGIAIVAVFIVLGLIGMAVEEPKPRHFWSKYDDPCPPDGCHDSR